MKKILIIIPIVLFILIINGFLLRGIYLNSSTVMNTKLLFFAKISKFFAEIPHILYNQTIFKKDEFNNFVLLNSNNKLPILEKNNHLERFTKFDREDDSPPILDSLLVLPRYDGDLSRSVVDIVDTNDFSILHTFKHDIIGFKKIVGNYKMPFKGEIEFDRFVYRHPILTEDAKLISMYPLFKLDHCSNIEWLNKDYLFHHSIENENNFLWSLIHLKENSNFIQKKMQTFGDFEFLEDAIVKINTDGEVVYKKSILEILVENKIIDKISFLYQILSIQMMFNR